MYSMPGLGNVMPGSSTAHRPLRPDSRAAISKRHMATHVRQE